MPAANGAGRALIVQLEVALLRVAAQAERTAIQFDDLVDEVGPRGDDLQCGQDGLRAFRGGGEGGSVGARAVAGGITVCLL